MRECPNGHEVDDLVKFCPKCGAEIQEKTEVRFCKKCGYERKGAEKFCAHCGHPFNGVVESSSKGLTDIDSIRKTSNKRLLLFFLIVPVILFGGYWLYNQDKRIEEKIKAEEKERKRIEEENKPANRLYQNAKNGNWVWGFKFAKNTDRNQRATNYSKNELYTIALFIHPINKTMGRICYLELIEHSYDNYCVYRKLTSNYSISDNILRATLHSNRFKGGFLKRGDNIILQIVNDGLYVKLVEIDGLHNVSYTQMEPISQNGRRLIEPPG